MLELPINKANEPNDTVIFDSTPMDKYSYRPQLQAAPIINGTTMPAAAKIKDFFKLPKNVAGSNSKPTINK
uniref:Uncharacterized protein n=1 Tax=Romanomermis culicivorax TaxID=13658 RepID=A0A915HMM3_ROMCU